MASYGYNPVAAGASEVMDELRQLKYHMSSAHTGKVLCVSASDNMQWILTGGEDTSAQLWHVNARYHCCRLVKVMEHEKCTDSNCRKLISPGDPYCNTCGAETMFHQKYVSPGNSYNSLGELVPPANERAAVTSVSFFGNDGPVVSTTRLGELVVTVIPPRYHDHEKHGEHEWPRSSLQVTNEEIIDVKEKIDKTKIHDGGEPTMLLGVAYGHRAGRGCASLISIHSEDTINYKFKTLCKIEQDERILSIQHLPGDVSQGAAMATVSPKFISLWNILGIVTQRLPAPQDKNWQCLHMVKPFEGDWGLTKGLLGATAGKKVFFWPLHQGTVIENDAEGKKLEDWPVQYNLSQPPRDFFIAPQGTGYVVQREDNTTVVHTIVSKHDLHKDEHDQTESSQSPDVVRAASSVLAAHADGETVEEPEGFPAASRLLRKDLVECTVEHPWPSNDTCMRQFPKKGKRMIVGFDSGKVEIWLLPTRVEKHMGMMPEKTADLRRITLGETVSANLKRLVAFAQVTAFAFSPATHFPKEVDKPIKFSTSFINLDTQQLFPTLCPSQLFFPEVGAVAGMMCIFLLLVLTAAPEKMIEAKIHLMRKPGYVKATKAGHFACIRVAVSMVSLTYKMFGVLIGTCSSVLIVPMCKICASVAACEHPADGSKPFLSNNPDIHCYGVTHLKLLGLFGIILPLYLYCVVPYALVEGDSEFMYRAHVFRPRKWKIHGIRKATLVFHGHMHPAPASIFISQVTETFAKVALPVICILTTSKPLLQTGAVTAVGLTLFVVSMMYPPLVDPVMSAVMQGFRLTSVMFMMCGMCTVVAPGNYQLTRGCLIGSMITSALWACYQIIKARMKQPSRGGDKRQSELQLLCCCEEERAPKVAGEKRNDMTTLMDERDEVDHGNGIDNRRQMKL